ncbi:MAG: phospholipase D family protein [Halioglobus sp.]
MKLSNLLLCIALVSACTVLPEAPPREGEFAQPATSTGALSTAAMNFSPPLTEEESAFHLLPAGRDALAWRIALIDNAVNSLDAQYYVWHDDLVGTLLLEHILSAADRGVKVRMLVDDMDLATAGTFSNSDKALAALDQHPNLQLRVFNPGTYRSGTVGALETLGSRFSSYNRRMHNKLLVADGQFAIVGGRNVGDEYFGLNPEHNFIDVDALTTGAIVPAISEGFAVFWNSDLAYPAHALADADQGGYEAIREENRTYLEERSDRLANIANVSEPIPNMLSDIAAQMHRGTAVFLEKQPLEDAEDTHQLYNRLNALAGSVESEVLTSTPYLIPVEGFLNFTRTDSESGVKTRFLTNSLASSNQHTVHAHYKKYRQEILEAGAQLFEMHHQPAGTLNRYFDTPPAKAESVTLHMKATVIDNQRCFIGTLNLDPRSIEINTEDVMYIQSSALCTELGDYIIEIMQLDNAWQVSQGEDGKLLWTSHEGTTTQQPVQKFSDRVWDFLYGLFPVEKQL